MARSTTAPDPATFSSFGAILRYLRRRQRLTQIELAIATGYSTAQISRLELNQRLSNPATLDALFVPALGLSDEPELVARLHELARAAPDQRGAPADAGGGAGAPRPDGSIGDGTDQQPGMPPAPAASPGAAAPMLVTKLYLPRPRPDLVARPRLRERLDAAFDAPLTLVSAPAGFGKTTLVADWLQSGIRDRGSGVRKAGGAAEAQAAPVWPDDVDLEPWHPKPEDGTSRRETRNSYRSDPRPLTPDPSVAWLSLDTGDSDLATFLRSLIAAFQRIAPAVGGTTIALLQGPQPPDPDTPLRLLLNDLTALPRDSVLVLDDYHLISTPAVHTALGVLLDHLPPQLHLVIATRADPPLPLARLRARGQLVELRAAEVRFTRDEAATFLTQVMGLPLSGAEVAALESRTEGWIAGLQLAALAMRDRSDLAGFIGAFTGSNRFVVDYLAEEVFERQPPHLQSFLLHTSILDRLCGSLCDAVMGAAEHAPRGAAQHASSRPIPGDSQAAYTQVVLEELERANLFVVPLDDDRRWYRYHQLFGEVLRERLVRGAAVEELRTLHHRASTWYAAHGLIEEAIRHALDAGMPDRAADLIEDRAELLIRQSEFIILRRWLAYLPEAVIEQRHRLALVLSAVLMTTGDFAAVERWHEAAERKRPTDAHIALRDGLEGSQPDAADAPDAGWLDDVPGVVLTHRSMMARAQNNLPHAITLGQAALEHLPTQFVFRRSIASWNLGMAQLLSGDLAAADASFAQMWSGVHTPEHLYTRIVAVYSQAQIRVIRGRLLEAAQLYQATLALAAQAGPLPAVGMLHIGLADVLREWNMLDAATQHVMTGLALCREFGQLDVQAAGHAVRARLYQASGDQPAADAELAHIERNPPQGIFDRWSEPRARAWLAHGQVEQAEQWAIRNGAGVDTPASYHHEIEQLVLARVLLARNERAQALALLDRVRSSSEAGGRFGAVLEALVLQAIALDALGDRPTAVETLQRALVLAEPAGYIRLFVDEGAPLATLLTLLSRTPPAAPLQPYLQRVRAAVSAGMHADDAAPTGPAPASLAEPLNAREQEVLRLFADALSNQEIADRLVVARSTVKWHINNLYSKLGVSTRAAALARAKELNLLER